MCLFVCVCVCVCLHCAVCVVSTVVERLYGEHCCEKVVCSLILVGVAEYEGVGGGRRQSDLETNHICTNNFAC